MSKKYTSKKARINTIEVEELACHLTGLDYDEIDADESIIDEKLQEVYGTTLDQFTDLIASLIPLIDIGKSPMTHKRYKGFSNTEKQVWFTKIEIE